MYERRLKIFFLILIAITAGLLFRAGQVQVLNATEFQEKADEFLSRTQYLETTRGSILDCLGRELAVDGPCMVAAVDYRAIQRNPVWIQQQALARLLARPDRAYRRADKAQRQKMLQEERAQVNADLDTMWRTLAEVSGKTTEEIEQIKAAIQRRVVMRQRWIWYKKYENALKQREDREPDPWLVDWLLGGDSGPQIDSFVTEIAELTEAHTILNNISTDVHNRLKKQLERFPGLVLRPSKHRVYVQPYAESLCHVLGHLSTVDADDLKNDPNRKDDLRRYDFNDLIGRGGVESLCDQVLRGSRGQITRQAGDNRIVSSIDPVPGKNVSLTIDAELQLEIERAFRHAKWYNSDHTAVVEEHEMHGAAVVIDIPTGSVRALVSYPTFDPNRFDDLYPALAKDLINRPLLNRATQMALEPGSTVKPIVGIGAITQGLIRVDQGIECTGYLIIDGKRLSMGRCWTATKFGHLGDAVVAHHRIPDKDPHPNGHLVLADAIQRSCNVYFETLGDRLHLSGLAHWYRQFGLGRKTGIGIPEWSGWVPDSYVGDLASQRSVSWFSAIGQAQVAATPIQMVNVAATIARDGVWLKPTLLANRADANPATRPADAMPDRVNLKLSSAAVAAAKEGMIRVINTDAGTGSGVRDSRVLIAGKTGTAEAAPLRYPEALDEAGRPVRDAKGNIKWITPPLSTRDNPNPKMRWYRASGASGKAHHAWFIGFAPARQPTIAFAVMLEYGGSGGGDAGPIAKTLLDACIKHGYLPAGQ